MSDFFWIFGSFLMVLGVYSSIRRRNSESSAEDSSSAPVPDGDAYACVGIMGLVSTNNSYDPMGLVLASLHRPQVSTLLEEDLKADIGGYMDVT